MQRIFFGMKFSKWGKKKDTDGRLSFIDIKNSSGKGWDKLSKIS